MRKKLLSLIIALCLITAMLGMSAYADSQTVSNGEALLAAINSAASGDTITLGEDISLSETLNIPEDKSLTLDLNGKALSFSNAGVGISNSGDLTITDSTATNGGYGIGSGRVYTTDVNAQGRHAVVNYGTLTIDGGIFGDSDTNRENDNDYQRGNAVRNFGTATINGGAFTCCDNYTGPDNNGYAYAVANGDSAHPNAQMTINYATVYGSVNGLIASDGGRLVVKNGSYTLGDGTENNLWRVGYSSGNGVIEIQGGNFVKDTTVNYGFFGGNETIVSGGTFEDKHNGNGIYADSGALYISGGIFKDKLTASTSASVVVSGGTFEGGIDTDSANINAPDGYEFQVSDGVTTVVSSGTKVFASGSGTASDPYIIKTVGQLEGFRNAVNNGRTFAGQYICLDKNIALTGEWTPIGNGKRNGSGYIGNAFSGTFDGNGNTISGLQISSGSENEAIGLFGVVSSGVVKNIVLDGVKINVSANDCAGGVVGLMVNGSVVSGCEVNGTVVAGDGVGGIVGRMTISGTISDCINNANVIATGANESSAAGIVGKAYYTKEDYTMTIERCTNNGAITGAVYHAGGISALCAANVTDCVNTGPISAGNTAGGIVAEQTNWGTISGCVNKASVVGNNNSGGIVGWVRYQNNSSYTKSQTISILNNTNYGAIGYKGNTFNGLGCGGIVGTIYNVGVVSGNENYAEFIAGSTFAAGIVGNLQKQEDNLYYSELNIEVNNNISTTTLDNITGECIDLYAYNNEGASGNFETEENSTAWAAQIGDQKYATLTATIEAAKSTPNTVITVLQDVVLTEPLNLSETESLTIQGDTKDVTISTSGIDGQKVFDGVPNGSFTLKDLTFEDAIVTIKGASGAVVVDGCTFQNTATTQGDKSGVLNVTGSKTGSSLTVIDSVFKDLKRSDTAKGNEFVGIYTSGSLGSITVEDSTFENIAGTALSLTDCGDIIITGNTFKNWANGSANNEGRVARVNFDGQTTPKIVFTDNKMIAGEQAKESFVKIGEIPEQSNPQINVGENYWSGKDPVNDVVTDGNPVLEIVINNETLEANELKENSSITGEDTYYLKETMRPEDLNTYIPANVPDPHAITITQPANGTVSTSLSNASKGATITVTATPNAGYELAYITVNGEKITGNTFVMPDEAVTVSAVFVTSSFPFTDVATGAWYYDAVNYVYTNGLMDGVSDTLFNPDGSMTRAMVWAILARLDGQAVTGANWATVARNWAVREGVSDGENANGLVTREQLATMIWRYVGEPASTYSLSAFTDAGSVSDWASTAMAWAVENGIITGVMATTLVPQGTASRAQCAAILMRCVEM